MGLNICLLILLFSSTASDLSDVLATIAPVSGSPLLGFNNIPKKPISIIDFHGTDDPIIPYDLNRYKSFLKLNSYNRSNNDFYKIKKLCTYNFPIC